jgi:signal transduction histidine kinase
MKSRAEALHGTMEIQPKSGEGTAIRLAVPVKTRRSKDTGH